MDRMPMTTRLKTAGARWLAPVAAMLFCAAGQAATPLAPSARRQTPKPTASPATLTRDTAFGEAIDILRNATSPPLNIIVLWRQIGDNADIYRETPIGFDSIPGLRLGQYLDTLLLSVSAGSAVRLGYTVDSGVIIIATIDALPVRKSVPRVYDVTDLVAEPSYAPSPGMMRMMMGGGMMGGGYGQGYGSPMGGFGQGLGAGYGGYNSASGLPGVVGAVGGRRR